MLLRIQRNGKELLGTRITHFELLHMLGLHDKHGVCCTGRGGGGNGARGWFGSRLSARLHSQTSPFGGWLSSWLGGMEVTVSRGGGGRLQGGGLCKGGGGVPVHTDAAPHTLHPQQSRMLTLPWPIRVSNTIACKH